MRETGREAYSDVQVGEVHELAVNVLESRVTEVGRVLVADGTTMMNRADAVSRPSHRQLQWRREQVETHTNGLGSIGGRGR